MNIKYYNKNNINEILWKDDENSLYVKNYCLPMILNGTNHFFKNVKAEMALIEINDKIIPIVISNEKENNCYVCSPTSQYIDYGIEELSLLKSKLARVVIKHILLFFKFFMKKYNFNKVVYVNNWLLSTNLYIELSKEEIKAINEKLGELYSGHVILYRSCNKFSNSDLISNLEENNASKILSRQIYITDPKNPTYRERKNFKIDYAFMKKTKFQIIDNLSEENVQEIHDLYNDLYIDKYTDLNPQFTLEFFKHSIDHNLFHYKLVKDGSEALAILGYFNRDGVMTTPIFGFDSQKPQKTGLYRILSMLLFKDSEEKNLVLNQSAGAAEFKRNRGGNPHLEYSYFFYNNCSFMQKMAWASISSIINVCGGFLMTRYKL